MATRTKLRTISSVDDVRAVLSNSNPARLMSVGSNWQKLRVGIRWCVNATSQITGTPRFAMGVCSGTTNRWDNGSGITTHFVGAVTSSATWSYSTNYVYGNSFLPAKRVGTTLTTGTSMDAIGVKNIASATRQMLFLDITKGSPNFTLNVFGINPAFSSDIAKATFEEIVAIETAAYTNYLWGTARTLAVNEADGTLNAVAFGWDRTVQEIELCDVAIVRFA